MEDNPAGIDLISSASNPLVKLARNITTRRRARLREGLFLLEGERAITTALEHGLEFHTFMIDSERREDVSPALFHVAYDTGSRLVLMEPALFRSVTDAEHPQPIAALARLPTHQFPAQATAIVALDGVRDPGNLGTIIRSAAAAGVDGIALLPGCVDAFHPKVVRASAGTIASIPIKPVSSIEQILTESFSGQPDVAIIAAESSGSSDYREIDWTRPLILIAGSEAQGLSEDSQLYVTESVTIPMAEGVESLNVSMAVTVLLFELRRERFPVRTRFLARDS